MRKSRHRQAGSDRGQTWPGGSGLVDYVATVAEDKPGSPGEKPPPWKVWVGVITLAVLAVAVVVVAQRTSSEVVSPTTQPTPRQVSTTQVDDAVADAVPDTTMPVLDPGAGVVADVEAALAAWAVFAGSGDPEVLAETFVIDGPQHVQLVDEVGALGDATAGSYQFDLVDPVVPEPTNGVTEVRSGVRFIQPSGDAFTYDWNIEMRWDETDQRWRLWTVSTVQ